MNDYVSKLDLAIWLALIAGRLLLCLSIFRKGLHRKMPWFSLYAVASTVESIVLLGVAFFFGYPVYYYVFYVTSHLVSLAAFLTLIECGGRVLPGLDLPKRGRALSLLLMAVAATVAFVGFWPLRFVENRIELAAHFAVGVAFIFIAAYARYLRLYWSRLVAGIAANLGLVYLVQGTIRAVAWHVPSALTSGLQLLSQVTYGVAILVWIVVVLSPWGTREFTEQDVLKIEAAFARIEAGLGTNEVKTV
jgi:hypothetical protein